MVRVHDGLPSTPLQMIIPAPRLPPQAASAPARADKPEGLLRNVLGALSGNN